MIRMMNQISKTVITRGIHKEPYIMNRVSDLHIQEISPLAPPKEIKSEVCARESTLEQISGWRGQIEEIIHRRDRRLLGIVGPCSLHDEAGAYDYARRLKELSAEVEDRILLIMRAYFEKPRTVLGWRGLILDPHLDGSYDIEEGIRRARRMLLTISEIGMPVGTEVLDPIIPQYIDDLISWAAIGARTTESQVHRNLASGLTIPVGFKNSTSGNLKIAVNAIKSSMYPASFIGVDPSGLTAVYRTTGNPSCHLILRGGNSSPNYYEEDVEEAVALMEKAGVVPSVIIDCSHGNSSKRYTRQNRVLRSVVDQVSLGNRWISGFMLESYITEGRQEVREGQPLTYGMSITDPCIGWEETQRIVRKAYQELEKEGGA